MTNTVFGCICVSPNSEVLMVRNRKGHKWSFPKGHREICDLTEMDCARRELMEEAGITVPEKSYGTIYLRAATYFVFLANNTNTCTIQDTNEIDEVKWFSLKELPESCNVDVSMFKNLIKLYRNIDFTTAERTVNYIVSEYANRKFMDMNNRLERKADLERKTNEQKI